MSVYLWLINRYIDIWICTNYDEWKLRLLRFVLQWFHQGFCEIFAWPLTITTVCHVVLNRKCLKISSCPMQVFLVPLVHWRYDGCALHARWYMVSFVIACFCAMAGGYDLAASLGSYNHNAWTNKHTPSSKHNYPPKITMFTWDAVLEPAVTNSINF